MTTWMAMTGAILLAASLGAQPPAGERGRRMEPNALKEHLNLTDQQVSQLQDARRQQLEAARPLLRQMGDKARALRQELDKDQPNAAQLGQILIDLKGLRQQMERQRTAERQKLLDVLTADQRAELKKLEEAARHATAARQAAALGLLDVGRGRFSGLGGLALRGGGGWGFRSRGGFRSPEARPPLQ